MPTASINAERPCLTVVITIAVADEQREAFLSAIRAAVDAYIAGQPGFISASFHRRLDAPGVLNYAQWESAAHYDAFMQSGGFASQIMSVFQQHGAMPSFSRYEVVGTHVAE